MLNDYQNNENHYDIGISGYYFLNGNYSQNINSYYQDMCNNLEEWTTKQNKRNEDGYITFMKIFKVLYILIT